MVVSNRQGSEDDPEFGSRGGIGGRESPQSSSTTRYKLSSTAPSWIPAETRCNGAEERGVGPPLSATSFRLAEELIP